MKFSIVAIVISALCHPVLGTYNCTTRYASTSVAPVKTYYSTSTIFTVTSTQTFGTQYVPTSTGISWTYISVSGSKTKTVPIGSSFTPIYKAPLGPPKQPAKRDEPEAAAPLATAAATFASAVVCKTTVTAGTYTQKGTATSTYTEYTTKKTVYQTTKVATSTSYAACAPSNIITATQSQQVGYTWSISALDICDYNEDRYAGEEYCNDVTSCCAFAQANQWGGFLWQNFTTPVHCVMFANPWGFETGKEVEQPYYIGNGPVGSGYFGPPS